LKLEKVLNVALAPSTVGNDEPGRSWKHRQISFWR